MREVNFKTENTVVENQRAILIHAKADCLDKRTGNTVPLTFYFLKNICLADATSDEIKNLISLSIMNLGFEFERLQGFKAEPVYFDAEKLWKEEHEQQSFQF